MPEKKERLFETFGEVARALGYSIPHVKRLWKKFGFRLKHQLGERRRMRMTEEELQRFKRAIPKPVKRMILHDTR